MCGKGVSVSLDYRNLTRKNSQIEKMVKNRKNPNKHNELF